VRGGGENSDNADRDRLGLDGDEFDSDDPDSDELDVELDSSCSWDSDNVGLHGEGLRSDEPDVELESCCSFSPSFIMNDNFMTSCLFGSNMIEQCVGAKSSTKRWEVGGIMDDSPCCPKHGMHLSMLSASRNSGSSLMFGVAELISDLIYRKLPSQGMRPERDANALAIPAWPLQPWSLSPEAYPKVRMRWVAVDKAGDPGRWQSGGSLACAAEYDLPSQKVVARPLFVIDHLLVWDPRWILPRVLKTSKIVALWKLIIAFQPQSAFCLLLSSLGCPLGGVYSHQASMLSLSPILICSIKRRRIDLSHECEPSHLSRLHGCSRTTRVPAKDIRIQRSRQIPGRLNLVQVAAALPRQVGGAR